MFGWKIYGELFWETERKLYSKLSVAAVRVLNDSRFFAMSTLSKSMIVKSTSYVDNQNVWRHFQYATGGEGA